MKTLVLTSFLIISISLFGQSELYNSKMTSALESYSNAKSSDDYISTAFQFQQIANVESDKWLPEYYYAMCYTMASYGVSADNATQKDLYLDEAEASLKKLKTMVPKESEVFALEGLFYTARLSVNPMERGQKYSVLSRKSIGIALALDSNNVRAKQLAIANDFGTAQFFGSDTEPICKKAQVLLLEWDNYTIKSPLHPDWGKGYLRSITKSCEPKQENEGVPVTNREHQRPTLKVEIIGLSSNNGVILMQLKDKNEKVIQATRGIIKNQKSEIIFDNLPKGDYSISYFHDANSNMTMDKDKYGRPTEGYGFSNNAKGFMKAPKFEETIFTFNQDLSLSLKIRN